jgi:hypothetical protein
VYCVENGEPAIIACRYHYDWILAGSPGACGLGRGIDGPGDRIQEFRLISIRLRYGFKLQINFITQGMSILWNRRQWIRRKEKRKLTGQNPFIKSLDHVNPTSYFFKKTNGRDNGLAGTAGKVPPMYWTIGCMHCGRVREYFTE